MASMKSLIYCESAKEDEIMKKSNTNASDASRPSLITPGD
jgi:hypothetical protein